MSKLRIILVLSVFISGGAVADIWKWVGADGVTHLVDTNTTIYTWVDESGEVFYSDTPDHEDAIAIQLVWHSKGDLAGMNTTAREDTQEYYCKRATEIYDSYIHAPRLYRTNEAGEREYLSEAEAQTTIDETKIKKDDLCT